MIGYDTGKPLCNEQDLTPFAIQVGLLKKSLTKLKRTTLISLPYDRKVQRWIIQQNSTRPPSGILGS